MNYTKNVFYQFLKNLKSVVFKNISAFMSSDNDVWNNFSLLVWKCVIVEKTAPPKLNLSYVPQYNCSIWPFEKIQHEDHGIPQEIMWFFNKAAFSVVIAAKIKTEKM